MTRDWTGGMPVFEVIARTGGRRHLAVHRGPVTATFYATACGMEISDHFAHPGDLPLCQVCARVDGREA